MQTLPQRKGIIGAGNWLVDHIKQIDRWPGEGNLCNIRSQETATGGGPCNVLFDLAAMTGGTLPLFAAGRVGRDDAGDWMLAEIKRRGIDTSGMKRGDAPTSYTDVMQGEGKRTFFHCRGANAEFAAADLADITAPARIFYLGYLLLLDKLDSEDDQFGTQGARLLADMRGRGYRTVVDFVSEAPEKFRRVVRTALPHIDALVVNELELGSAFGYQVRDNNNTLHIDVLKKAMKQAFAGGLRELAVIHYPEGACAMRRDGEFVRVNSFDVKHIVGTNGAGDAFCAGILYALHEAMPLADALLLGGACSAANLHSPSASGGAIPLAEMRQKFDWTQNNLVQEKSPRA